LADAVYASVAGAGIRPLRKDQPPCEHTGSPSSGSLVGAHTQVLSHEPPRNPDMTLTLLGVVRDPRTWYLGPVARPPGLF
jgi:hypothetical protein